MKQLVECNWISLNKAGEELCGDSVMIRTKPDSFVAVLSDGLGSGVKASILSSITAEIAARMFEADGTVEDVMQTLAETLPECSVRKLAYATFAVLIVYNGRDAHIVLFDSPPLILLRNAEVIPIPVEERQVKGRIIKEAHFELRENDYMVLVSDGYEHAGLGGIFRLGWGWKNVATAVQRFAQTGMDTVKLTEAMSKTCLKLYNDKPGDDATVICMKVRPAISVCVLTGPPANKDMDEFAVSRLMAAAGDKIICGGSTAQMTARILREKLEVEWVPPWKRTSDELKRKGSPPTALIKGINLVTEGILTLGQALEIMRSARTIHDLPRDNDAATRLARYLLEADEIHLIVGTAINPNQVADLIRGEPMRMGYIRELVSDLNARNKIVTLERI
ncbi:MAG: hypothetical protein CVU54_05315 [Deltaproteobacteria bacterium HGW-Deltaproteobacteria-12]|nr:MAG: hypothetical protein CVU54_05315 [Deltaproteobacteria bacterium HGW-Deltaproteobacteria-12]